MPKKKTQEPIANTDDNVSSETVENFSYSADNPDIQGQKPINNTDEQQCGNVSAETIKNVSYSQQSTEIQELEKAYQFANCSFNISLSISAQVGEERRVIMGLKSHAEDKPIFTVAGISEISSVQSVLDELLAKFQSELPARLAAAVERLKNAPDDEDEEIDEGEGTKPPKATKTITKKSPKTKQPELPTIKVDAEKPITGESDGNKVQLSLF
jgi:hypothetical protein